jgi:hypothetical protein
VRDKIDNKKKMSPKKENESKERKLLQIGFRKNHSTSLALTHLVNKITSAIDRKEVTAGACILRSFINF